MSAPPDLQPCATSAASRSLCWPWAGSRWKMQVIAWTLARQGSPPSACFRKTTLPTLCAACAAESASVLALRPSRVTPCSGQGHYLRDRMTGYPGAAPGKGVCMSLVAPTGDLQLKSVLIATDFSETSEKPLRHALAIARHYEAKLYLAHVVSSLGFTLVGPDAVIAAADAAWRDFRQLEAHLVQSEALAGLRHEVIVLQGDVWEELEKVVRQEQVDLVVIGTHGRRGLGKLLLGSVAEQIFHRAECLVLTVGPGSLQDSPVGSIRSIRPFLFATDFSGASLHAL